MFNEALYRPMSNTERTFLIVKDRLYEEFTNRAKEFDQYEPFKTLTFTDFLIQRLIELDTNTIELAKR